MFGKLLKFVVIVLVGALSYFFLSFHVVYLGTSVELIKKKRLTPQYAIVNAADPVEHILRSDTLREAGVGALLVKLGRLTEERRLELEEQFKSDPVVY